MLKTENHDQTILDFAQGGYLRIAADSVIMDRNAAYRITLTSTPISRTCQTLSAANA